MRPQRPKPQRKDAASCFLLSAISVQTLLRVCATFLLLFPAHLSFYCTHSPFSRLIFAFTSFLLLLALALLSFDVLWFALAWYGTLFNYQSVICSRVPFVENTVALRRPMVPPLRLDVSQTLSNGIMEAILFCSRKCSQNTPVSDSK